MLMVLLLLMKAIEQAIWILQSGDQIHCCRWMIVRMRSNVLSRTRVERLEELVPFVVAFGCDRHGSPEGGIVGVDRMHWLLQRLMREDLLMMMRLWLSQALRWQKVWLQAVRDGRVRGFGHGADLAGVVMEQMLVLPGRYLCVLLFPNDTVLRR